MDSLLNSILSMVNDSMDIKAANNFGSRIQYPKYLFHRTKEESVNKIILFNKLIAGTRSVMEDNRVSMTTNINGDEFGPITFVIDADKLREDYDVHKFDYNKSMGQYAYEKEWYTDVDISELSKYTVDVVSDYDESFDRLSYYSDINRAVEKLVKLPVLEE